MRTLLALTLVLVAAQTPTLSPYCLMAQHLQQQEGNPGHQPPPEDWLCTPAGYIKNGKKTADKPCACHPVGDAKSSCEERTEDAACNVFCYKRSCACPTVDCK
jgi:hypothetical protein